MEEQSTTLNNRYRLDEQVGAGGMSTVYRAFDLTLERPVAIKLLHREIAEDSDQLERFRREARAVAQLSHPHIVTVIDAGEDQGRPYIVFEFVEGETLKALVQRRGTLPIAEAVAYTIEIARGLAAAHQRQMVHRDVKPHNVLLDPEGSAKVTDFGIARTLEEEGLTETGRVIGTTDYVSPEQARGQEVNPRSDLYSLGIVLFELLTGQVPFSGDNQVAVAMKHVKESLPDVRSLRPEVSATLATVIDRATAKDPARRYQDATEMIADLGEVLALETARSGKASSEVTTVLKTLPEGKKTSRLALRLRHPAWSVAVALSIVAVAVGLALLLANQVQRGTGGDGAPVGLKQVSLSQTAAHDFDPIGGDGEHSDEVNFVLDRDPNTTWSSELYQSGTLSKAGVGLYLDASPGVAARELQVATATPGWEATVYAAAQGPPKTTPPDGWVMLSNRQRVGRKARFILDTANQPFRYYLVWITKLPAQNKKVEISEIELYS